MKTQEGKVIAVERNAQDAEVDSLLSAYRIQFDVWKMQNDNYFKRVQIMMVVIQAALFTTAFRFVPPKTGLSYEIVFIIAIAVLGILSAYHWTSLNEKQSQYMEFCRRTLRNLEARLVELGVPLRYFTLEGHVFGPLRTEIANSAGTSLREKEDRHIVHFDWSSEDYPDPDTKEAKNHELRKVCGGMIAFDKNIAWGILVVWVLGLSLLVLKVIVLQICL